jgi:hypothetical protein
VRENDPLEVSAGRGGEIGPNRYRGQDNQDSI